MVCKTNLAERQAAMRKRQAPNVATIPDEEISKAVTIYVRLLSNGPERTEDVTAQLVAAGVKFGASEQARKLLGIVERIVPRAGGGWLQKLRKAQNSVVKIENSVVKGS